MDLGFIRGDEEPRLAEPAIKQPLPEGPTTSPSLVGVTEQDGGLPPRSGPSTEQANAPSTEQLGAATDRPVTPPDVTDQGKEPMAPSTMEGATSRMKKPYHPPMMKWKKS
jgi:hypothetical protein